MLTLPPRPLPRLSTQEKQRVAQDLAKRKSTLAKEDPFGNFSPDAKSANEQALDAFFGPESDDDDGLSPQERMLKQERARIAACARPIPDAPCRISQNV